MALAARDVPIDGLKPVAAESAPTAQIGAHFGPLFGVEVEDERPVYAEGVFDSAGQDELQNGSLVRVRNWTWHLMVGLLMAARQQGLKAWFENVPSTPTESLIPPVSTSCKIRVFWSAICMSAAADSRSAYGRIAWVQGFVFSARWSFWFHQSRRAAETHNLVSIERK